MTRGYGFFTITRSQFWYRQISPDKDTVPYVREQAATKLEGAECEDLIKVIRERLIEAAC